MFGADRWTMTKQGLRLKFLAFEVESDREYPPVAVSDRTERGLIACLPASGRVIDDGLNEIQPSMLTWLELRERRHKSCR
jgi:hypothetical protein